MINIIKNQHDDHYWSLQKKDKRDKSIKEFQINQYLFSNSATNVKSVLQCVSVKIIMFRLWQFIFALLVLVAVPVYSDAFRLNEFRSHVSITL
jgi:hypothetical protein